MIRKKWNDSWLIEEASANSLMATFGGASPGKVICLPYDAMIHEKRTQETKNAHQTGFYPGNVYTYKKKFLAPKEWENKTVTLEFEGVYMNSMVYINGDYAGGHPHGYTNFYVCADDFLKYGEENEVKVVVNNSMELNSRWYSGSGIYRNVNILVGNLLHIKTDGIRITTPMADQDTATVVVDIALENQMKCKKQILVLTKIIDADGNIVAQEKTPITIFGGTIENLRQRILVDHPNLWDCDNPYLYTYHVSILSQEEVLDEEINHFGIRTLSLDAKNGLRINGKTVKLRGACIHHDNGVIGACTLERAEERRCQQLKAAGFNCIRSAHHPISKAMLDACDREGMLVMDELSDMWTRSKNVNDYAQSFVYHWEYDVEQMVLKDFNHPCVIMYSTGNEILEAGTPKGTQLNRDIANKIRSLDDTRFITNGFNGLLACMDKMGEILSSITGKSMEELMSAKPAESSDDVSDAGSDALNGFMGMLHGPLADAIAVHPIMNQKIDEFVSALDIAGYNYLTARHVLDHEINPNRVVLGTETFPADIVRLWKIVKGNNHVIGDMTWTGYDYLGEAGIGIFYYDGRAAFMANWPSSVAYIGDIDIIGYRRPISYYREIVFGLRKDPYVSVDRLNHYGEKTNKTPWMWKDDIASWTWHGYEGKPAVVNVYADAEEVELFLNGKSLGRKPAGEASQFLATYEVTYEPGELLAISYQGGVEIGRCNLITASENVELDVQVDRSEIKADGADLAYITVGLVDENGNHNLQAKKKVKVTVEGCGTLQGFGSADPETTNSYDNVEWDTYDGFVLAVIRAGFEAGEIKVTFESEGCISKTVIIKTIAEG